MSKQQKTTSTEISDRFWNLPQKAGEETQRELTFIDDIIAKAHIERLLLENLDGIHTAFDGGAGYGRFSIPLAKRGVKVTHFDISEGMIAKAKEIADQEGVAENITFVHGALEDLTEFGDRQFDMVMSFDAPISYTYPNHETVMSNLVRIASKRLVISVYSRLAWTYLFDPAQKAKYILDKSTNDPLARWTLDHTLGQLTEFKPNMTEVREFFKTGLMEKTEDTAAEYDKGKSPWPVSYSFMPDELIAILQKFGARNIKLSGPGALSRSIPGEVLRNIMQDEPLKQNFLDFCFWYDSQPSCLGMGKDNIVAIADVLP
ncbi:MAG: methyltransferase domain-containing protein [Oscillospiraceae bacterium]|jgi:2-polyprenyl-3-methyl-5-hydroxy-6-metoxy-1,4-benzoquinol methylase|nr:methyltransferase domain-containing protein [Oscillospiraceae bacterium]